MKFLIIAVLMLVSLPAKAIDISLDVLFVAQQENAPSDQFTLHLQEHYDDIGDLRFGLAFIENTGGANLFATELYGSYLSTGAQRGGTWEIDTSTVGAQSSLFSGYNHIEPVFPPQSVTDAIGPAFTYLLMSGPGIAPGYLFEFFWGSGSALHVVDAFNSGALKFGLETTDGQFTYVAAADVPESGGLLVVLGVIFVLMVWLKRVAASATA